MVQALRVLLRAKGGDAAVSVAVGLQALEDGLAVVEHVGGRVQRYRLVRAHLRVVPALPFRPVNGDHVVCELLAERRICENLLALGVWGGVIGRGNCELNLSHRAKGTPRFSTLGGRNCPHDERISHGV